MKETIKNYKAFEEWVIQFTGKSLWEHQMLLDDEQYTLYLETLLEKYEE